MDAAIKNESTTIETAALERIAAEATSFFKVFYRIMHNNYYILYIYQMKYCE